MQQTLIKLPEIHLIGLTARTNNLAETEPTTAKIGATIGRYFHGAFPRQITNRKTPGVTYCVYTEYESDLNGDYTYFIGEAVTVFDDIPAGFSSLIIPEQTYAKFTTNNGSMPEVVIAGWQKIWQMNSEDFGGKRNYIADFEIYDERAHNPKNLMLDIYIGITS